MGAFQSGFGMGQQAFNQAMAWKDRELERTRQEKLDAQNTEAHGLRMKVAGLQADELEREKTEREGARLAATPQKAEEGYATGLPGAKSFYRDESAAQAQAENEAFINGADVPQVEKAAGVTGGGKPTIAGPGVKIDNSREAVTKRTADYWRSLGQNDKADKIEADAAETTKKLYDLGRDAIWRNSLQALNTGGEQAFVDALYKGYNDGFSAQVVRGAGGGGVVNRVDADGKVVGSMSFKSPEDLVNQAYGIAFPDKAFANRQATAADIAKENRKTAGQILVEQAKAHGRSVRAGNWVQTENGDWVQLPGDPPGTGRSGASGASGGKTPKSTQDIIIGSIEDKFKIDGDPNAAAAAKRLVPDAVRLNPGQDAGQIQLAVQTAVTQPEAIKPRLDFGNGAAVMAYVDPSTNRKTALFGVPSNYQLSQDDVASFRSDVDAYLKQEDAKSPGVSALLKAASVDRKQLPELQRHLQGTLQNEMMSQWRRNYVAQNRREPGNAEVMDAFKKAEARAAQIGPEAARKYSGALDLIARFGTQKN
jgi:hypothetical protein